jgi:hypothetical protein
MTTISIAKEKWARKTADAGRKWKAGVTGKEDEYAKGIGLFAGVSAGSTMRSNYAKGVGAVSESQFAEAVRGKQDKWASRLAEAISG